MRHDYRKASAAAADSSTSPAPNALRQGTTTRTVWPPAAGTKRWHQLYGDALLCVRHRRDAAGLRRVITVELVVGTVARRPGQTTLQDHALYPVKVQLNERGLKATLKAQRAQWDPESACWYVRGITIRQLHLEDRIWMQVPRRKLAK